MSANVRLLVPCLAGLAVSTLAGQTLDEQHTARLFGLSRYVAPNFPVIAEDQHILAGLATVAVAWEGNGAPSDVLVLRANDDSFGAAAREAAEQWRRAPTPGEREVVIYDLKFMKQGVVVSWSNSVGSRIATQVAADAKPLRIPSAAELDAPLKAIHQPMPAYPDAARGRGDEARVVVEFYVDQNGRVRAPVVQESTAPEFAAEALRALQNWQYEVPRKDGQPVVMSERWEFEFRKSG